jgi:ABC-type branched-subunit amino acid transport system substrate-binding protein/Tfp pilus assembly protein PilF
LNRAIVAAFLLAITFLLAGHRAMATPATTPLQQALELYQSGSPERAAPLLKTAISQHPGDPDAWQAHLALARIYHKQNRPADMLAQLGAIPPQRRNAEALFLEGLGLLGTGQLVSGMDRLRSIPASDLNSQQQQQRLTALSEGASQLDRHAEALYFIQQSVLLNNDPAHTSRLLQQAHTLLKNRCSDAELAEAGFLYQGTAMGQDALLQQAWRHKNAGRTDQALLLVNSLLKNPVDFPFRDNAQLLLQELSGRQSRALGVLLPLSGRFSNYGQQVLKGMELALELHNLQAPKVTLLVRDSAGESALAEQLTGELASSPQILGVLGPLTGSAASAAAQRAQKEQLPMLTLSQHDGLPQVGPWIFRDSLTIDLQVRTLVDYAVNQKKMASFGILAPDTRLGREISQAFSDAVRQSGAKITAIQSYNPKTTDFRRQIKLLQGSHPNTPESKNEPGTSVQRRSSTPFDALFVPANPDQLALIAPQLPFYGLSGAVLLGNASWDAPNLLPLVGTHLNNAVFVSGFYRFSPYPFVQKFVDQYSEHYGTEPSLLAAQGFDVASIVLSLLKNPEITSRESLRQALSQLRNYPGVTGATSFTPDGDAEKALHLLQVKQGTLVQLN